MLLKIILIFIIACTWYGLTVFMSPETSSTIDKALWISGFSEKIRWGKTTFDTSITDIPSLGEFKSWALDMSQKLSNGIDTTKEKIDTVRWGAQKVEETFNDAKNTYDDAKETFDAVKGTVDEMSGKIQEFEWVVEWVKNITNSGQ